MLDLEIKEQLKTVFAQMTTSIELLFDESTHANQAELVQMFEDFGSTSTNIIQASGSTSRLEHSDQPETSLRAVDPLAADPATNPDYCTSGLRC